MKIKKHISLFLAFFLLVSHVGFAIDVHYCGGGIASVKPIFWKKFESKNTLEESCCPPKSPNNLQGNSSCCKDKIMSFEKKFENDIVNSISFKPNFNFLIENWQSFVCSKLQHFESNKTTCYYCDVNAPPRFKLYHQYVFYA